MIYEVDFELFLRVEFEELMIAQALSRGFDEFLKVYLSTHACSHVNIEGELRGLQCKVYLKLHAHASAKLDTPAKNSSAFLKAATTTLLHTISQSGKASYAAHIKDYLGEDKFLMQHLPIDPSANGLFESHLVLGLITQIIKDVEELMNLPPEKILLRWMNLKAGYQKIVTYFSSDIKDGEAYAHLLNVLAPEHGMDSQPKRNRFLSLKLCQIMPKSQATRGHSFSG
ncbi:hypothetical protein Ancab_034057 [Ancistrocladus abbreviatus]